MVATSDFGAVSVISQWNEYCCLHRRPFLPVVLKDLIGYVGPLVLPGETACFECLKLRERTHQSQPDLRRQIEAAAEAEPPIGLLPPLTSSLGDIASIELVKFYGLGLPIGHAGVVREVNLIAGDISSQVVHRMPRCPICTPLNQRPSLSTVRRETILHSSG
jgi:bacteriocin biosynthesis cyclodehydratase domain-containing protein